MARQEYEMSQAQLDAILEAYTPVPRMLFGGRPPPSMEENANAAWRRLGDEFGFDSTTVRPGRTWRHFTAEPTTAPQRQERT